MPPPGSPTGFGMCVKKSRLTARMPWLTTKNRMKASGTSAIRTDSAQKPTNADDSSLRTRRRHAAPGTTPAAAGSGAGAAAPLRAMLQMSSRDSELTISVMMKSTRPISTSA